MRAEICWHPQRHRSTQQHRDAHWGKIVRQNKPIRPQARPDTAAVADRHVDALAREIHQPHAGGDAHLDAGMLGAERRQPRHQPLCRQRRRGAHHHNAPASWWQQFIGRRTQVGECRADVRQIGSAIRGERQRRPCEQTQAQLLLQTADAMADGGLRQIQFHGRTSEAAMPRRRLERAETVQRWQDASAWRPVCGEISSCVRGQSVVCPTQSHRPVHCQDRQQGTQA